MFNPKYYNRYLDDYFDRQYYGARLKLKKFDTEEFQSLSYIYTAPGNGEEERIPTAVDVRNVSFHYNSFTPILNKISLQVPQGKIYALLGASGCGKTTLLRMILGRLQPLTGIIRVFNAEPGTPESNIPGRVVGYMPQELALFELLTIKEVLHYYGQIYGLEASTIDEKVEHFISFLNLPTSERKVGQLSGGQQRRVSLAVTLIHEPPLLILDEPTVGVDSLLRCRIWNYLEDLCKNQGTTVLITTHYTEEARNAFRVGFIDSGTLLAQDNPERLIFKYSCTSLEDVFLELCLHKGGGQTIKSHNTIEEEGDETDSGINMRTVPEDSSRGSGGGSNSMKRKRKLSMRKSAILKRSSLKRSTSSSNHAPLAVLSTASLAMSTAQQSAKSATASSAFQPSASKSSARADNGIGGGAFVSSPPSLNQQSSSGRGDGGHCNVNRLHALLTKNYILFKRNPVSIILLNILPIIQIALYCISFERNPQHIPIAVVNRDNRSNSLSNLFLSNLGDTVRVVPYKTVDRAIESIQKVDTWLAVAFPRNFSRNFKRRFTKQEKVSQRTIDGSKILLYPDNTHSVFALYTFRALIDAFEVFVRQVGEMLGYNPSFFGSPLQLMPPVYGSYRINYGEFMSAGMIISVVHGMSMLVASFAVVRERNEGHLERGFVAGVKPAEIILSHIIYLLLPVLSQVIWVIGVSAFYFKIKIVGELWQVFAFALLSALQGLLFGVCISTLCPTEVASLVVVFIIEMPLVFTSGTLYPLESLSQTMRNIMMWNPLTLPINSLRNIMLRGWTFTNYYVFIGLASSISYSLVVVLFTFTFFQIMNHH